MNKLKEKKSVYNDTIALARKDVIGSGWQKPVSLELPNVLNNNNWLCLWKHQKWNLIAWSWKSEIS